MFGGLPGDEYFLLVLIDALALRAIMLAAFCSGDRMPQRARFSIAAAFMLNFALALIMISR